MSDWKSSMFSHIHYDEKEAVLSVTYKDSGKRYTHSVPPEKFQAMMKSDSIGRYFNEHIRKPHPGTHVKD